MQWLQAAAQNPAFKFLHDPQEDIYLLAIIAIVILFLQISNQKKQIESLQVKSQESIIEKETTLAERDLTITNLGKEKQELQSTLAERDLTITNLENEEHKFQTTIVECEQKRFWLEQIQDANGQNILGDDNYSIKASETIEMTVHYKVPKGHIVKTAWTSTYGQVQPNDQEITEYKAPAKPPDGKDKVKVILLDQQTGIEICKIINITVQ